MNSCSRERRATRLAVTNYQSSLLTLLSALMIVLFATFSQASLGDTAQITVLDNPHPFSRSLSIASDVDMQTAAFTKDFHDKVNGELGLNLGDSIWVMGSRGANLTSFFKGGILSGIGNNEEDFRTFVSRWHSGDIDHFHSWASDSYANFSVEFPIPQLVSKEGLLIRLESDAGNSKYATYEHDALRLVFDSEQVFNAEIELEVFEKVIQVPAGEVLLLSTGVHQHVVIDVGFLKRVVDGAPSVFDVTAVNIRGLYSSSGTRVTAKLTGYTYDWFNRIKILGQQKFLDFFDIRPLVSTSHGGFTGHNSYSIPGQPRTLSLPLEVDSKHLVAMQSVDALSSLSPYFHGDVLQEVGVLFYWPLLGGSLKHFDEFSASFESWGESVVMFSRSVALFNATSTPQEESLLMSRYGVALPSGYDVYCGDVCNSSQGNYIDNLVYLAIYGGEKIKRDLMLYTHFGTGSGGPIPPDELDSEVFDALKVLSGRFLGYGDYRAGQERIWVAPPGTWLRQKYVTEELAQAVKMENGFVEISLDDMSTGIVQLFPDFRNLLHGFSLHLASDKTTPVYVDGKLHTHVYSKQTEAGVYLTTLGVAGRTSVLGKLNLEESARNLRSDGVSYSFTQATEADAQVDRALHKFVLDVEREGEYCFEPRNLSLRNISHFSVALEDVDTTRPTWSLVFKVGAGTYELSNTLDVEKTHSQLLMADDTAVKAGSDRIISAPVYATQWRKGGQDSSIPTLPIGAVDEVCMVIEGESGDNISIVEFDAYGSQSKSSNPDDTIFVGGWVRQFEPRGEAVVRLTSATGFRMDSTIGSDGYFMLPGIKRGVYELSILAQGFQCQSSSPQKFEFTQSTNDLALKEFSCEI